MTKRELAAEVERLRAEVAALRAHVCPPSVPVCNCGVGVAPGLLGCPVHTSGVYVGDVPPWNGYGFVNTCGAAGYNPPLTFAHPVKPGQTYEVTLYPTFAAAAGCAAGALTSYIVNV